MVQHQSGMLNKLKEGEGEEITDVASTSLQPPLVFETHPDVVEAVAKDPVGTTPDFPDLEATTIYEEATPDLDTENWMSKLREDEIFNSDHGPAPRLHGLRRLAKPYILTEESKVNALIIVPREYVQTLTTKNGSDDVMSQSQVVSTNNFPMASVTFNITVLDGRTFSDSADAFYSSCEKLGLFPTAVASARAEARCLRKVLGIREHAAEEIVDKDAGEELAPNDDSAIKPEQIKLIDKMLKDLDITLKTVLETITTREIFSVEELTTGEARKALRLLNDQKKKNKKKGSKKS